MDRDTISISIHVSDEGFYCNASIPNGDFVCTTAQPTVEMSIASAMPSIRKYADTLESGLLERRDPDIELRVVRSITDAIRRYDGS